ncbi:MAG: hypothetical protein KFB96_06060 [Thiocapsa sp.]|uniref:asparagine synthetase B family protein n=1 Tax=Thiocapsa sp. TaxID=2024551 RepID=UPI001BCAA422|nr:asparagine synthase-related protein [Thiocapsa sp.]QVL50033.1 MAG: hypothetical protein KFB96_06060 [Thiocapsa sp.]
MSRAIAHWGTDHQGCWAEGWVVLGARDRYLCEHGRQPAQLLIAPDLILVGHVRLDDREPLCRTLGVPVDLADLQLFARAWRRWGSDCAAHVLGDWVCAVWDRQARRLWIGRDAAGNTGLYYWHDSRRLIFATALKALLAHPEVPRHPNAYAIARQLTLVIDPGEDAATEYRDIRRLPGGHALRCDGRGVQVYPWWQPEQLSELGWTREADYFDAFREVYAAAVRDRLRRDEGPVALMLSAGLDSGSVAALAAPMLADAGGPLLAYVAVPRFVPDGAPAGCLGDEGPVARSLAEHIGNIVYHSVASEDMGIARSLERMLEIHDLPSHAAANQFWIQDILQQCHAAGARVVLTGQGGNGTVSWAGAGNLRQELTTLGVGAAFVDLLRGGRGQFWPLIKTRALKPLLSPLYRQVGLRRRQPRPTWEYSAIHANLVAESDLLARMGAAGADPADPGSPSDDAQMVRFRLGRLGSASLGALWMDAGAAYGLEVLDPTRDRRVIEFCWRVPPAIFWAHGTRRGLIRKGMADVLPASVLTARVRGRQAADIGYRVLADREAIGDALDRVERHALANAWLDVPKMRAVLVALEHGVTPHTSLQAGSILLRGLGVGLFLTRF